MWVKIVTVKFPRHKFQLVREEITYNRFLLLEKHIDNFPKSWKCKKKWRARPHPLTTEVMNRIQILVSDFFPTESMVYVFHGNLI